MLENRYYAIQVFSYEWWNNILATIIAIVLLLWFSSLVLKRNKVYILNLLLGSCLVLRHLWFQWYQLKIGTWNVEWSLPIQMCSLSSLLSGVIPLLINFNVNKKTVQGLFEFLFYCSIGGFYSILTPVFTAGTDPLIYLDYYISHGGIVFIPLYLYFILDYRPRKRSWLKIFFYGQPLLVVIHIINLIIGGQSNYFYTMEPPIADNPLVMGSYPYHIFILNGLGLIHFWVLYIISTKSSYLLQKIQNLVYKT